MDKLNFKNEKPSNMLEEKIFPASAVLENSVIFFITLFVQYS